MTLTRRFCTRAGTLAAALSLLGCAGAGLIPDVPEVPPRHTVEEFRDQPIAYVSDPWERFNRSMYRFNYYLDRYLFLPVVTSYEYVTPVFVQERVSNFFNNIGEIKSLTNALFQLKGKQSGTILGRFLTNSTLGVGGLFDPASALGLNRHVEDFGQTLGYWGVTSGPYLVLPVFGPSSTRDAGGLAVDGAISYGIYTMVDPFQWSPSPLALEVAVGTLDLIDARHQQSFRYFESGYPFEYYMVRFFTHEKRELDAAK